METNERYALSETTESVVFKRQNYIEFREKGKYPEPGNFSFVDWQGCQSGGFTLQFHFQLPLKDLEIHVYDAYVLRSNCSRNVSGIPSKLPVFYSFKQSRLDAVSVLDWDLFCELLSWRPAFLSEPTLSGDSQSISAASKEAHWTNLDLARGK